MTIEECEDESLSDDSTVPVRVSPIEHDEILGQPSLLVWQRIRHKFEVVGKPQWYEGTVLNHNTNTSEFKVIYDGEDDTYWFPLLEDMSKGELFVVAD